MHDLVHKLFHNQVIMGIISGHTSSFEKINVQWAEWLKMFKFVMVIQRGEKHDVIAKCQDKAPWIGGIGP